MMTDLMTTIIANFLFSIRMVPLILIIIGGIRGVILLVFGRRREFEDWTRNRVMATLSTFFCFGMIVHMAIRYVIARLFFIKVYETSFSATYMEPNIFMKIDSPPRTSIAIVSFFVASVLSVFVAFFLLFLPGMFAIGDVLVDIIFLLLCWWTAIGILFNTSIRGGDISLIVASIKNQPKSGIVELFIVAIGLLLIYTQLWGIAL